MSSIVMEQALEVINLTVPDQPHPGFNERFGNLSTDLRLRLVGAVAVFSENADQADVSLQVSLGQIGEQYKKDLHAFNVVRSLDDYLHNRNWQYPDEGYKKHHDDVLNKTLDGLAAGNTEGYCEIETSADKQYEIAKFAEAFYLGGLRVLIVAPTSLNARNNRENIIEAIANFAPSVPPEAIGDDFDIRDASKKSRIVVSAYESLVDFADTGEIGEFDVILADEPSDSMGSRAATALKTFSPHAVKIGFMRRDKPRSLVNEMFPFRYHHGDQSLQNANVGSMDRDEKRPRVTPVGQLVELIDDTDSWAGRDPQEVILGSVLFRKTIEDALRQLTGKEQEVIKLRFGLTYGIGMERDEVGKELGVTAERIRQIETKALAKLRHSEQNVLLREWLEYVPDSTAFEARYKLPPASWPINDWRKFWSWRTAGQVSASSTGAYLTAEEAESIRAISRRHKPTSTASSHHQHQIESEYQRSLQKILREVYEYGDTAEPIIQTIARGLYEDTDRYFAGAIPQARHIIYQGLMIVPTSEGKAVERKQMHNNWKLKRQCLEQFTQMLPDILEKFQVSVAVARVIADIDPEYFRTAYDLRIQTLRQQISEALIGALRRIADEQAEDV